MADTDITFTGLWYLRGTVVSVAVAGLDCGDFVVDTHGLLVVPITANPALSSSHIALTAAKGLEGPNICGVSIGGTIYRIPVVIGRAYTTKGQMFRPASQQDVKSQTGDGLGKTRRGHMYSILFVNSGPGFVGTDFSAMYVTNFKQGDGITAWSGTNGFDGVYHDTLADSYGFDTLLSWKCDRPVPYMVSSTAVHLHAQDR